jgi:hypothetical protein
MTPKEFLSEVVRPNVSTFHDDFASFRHAFNAVAAVDALAAHLFMWCKANAPAEVAGSGDDTVYRGTLASRCPAFRLLRDISKAQKHVHLTRGSPQVTRENQVNVRPIGAGKGGIGCGRAGGPPQVVVDINGGVFDYVEDVVDEALAFIEGEMRRLNV